MTAPVFGSVFSEWNRPAFCGPQPMTGRRTVAPSLDTMTWAGFKMLAAASMRRRPKTREESTSNASRFAPRSSEAMSARIRKVSPKLIRRKKPGDRLTSNHTMRPARRGSAARRSGPDASMVFGGADLGEPVLGAWGRWNIRMPYSGRGGGAPAMFCAI